MRLKKGFTLAEILIVLMVIGVIATMTIPSMMKGVTEAQFKAGYKKAYNTIANFAAMERVSGQWPSRISTENLGMLYKGLNSALSVTSFAMHPAGNGEVISNADYTECATVTVNGGGTEGIGVLTDANACGDANSTSAVVAAPANFEDGNTDDSLWLITEDNIAYTILTGGTTGRCGTKQRIGNQADHAAAMLETCYYLVADVNGLSKGPNSFELQGLTQDNVLDNATPLETITGDQFGIYLGTDGVSAGPKTTTVTGRVMADLK